MFQSVGRRYVQYFIHTYRRSGTLLEGRYRATVVDSEQYLLTLMRYIELNPVRAGMVAHKGWALGNDRFKDKIEAVGSGVPRQKEWAGRGGKIIVSDPIV